jgi:hypothetical protein
VRGKKFKLTVVPYVRTDEDPVEILDLGEAVAAYQLAVERSTKAEARVAKIIEAIQGTE